MDKQKEPIYRQGKHESSKASKAASTARYRLGLQLLRGPMVQLWVTPDRVGQ